MRPFEFCHASRSPGILYSLTSGRFLMRLRSLDRPPTRAMTNKMKTPKIAQGVDPLT
jgi:hypothetical protein